MNIYQKFTIVLGLILLLLATLFQPMRIVGEQYWKNGAYISELNYISVFADRNVDIDIPRAHDLIFQVDIALLHQEYLLIILGTIGGVLLTSKKKSTTHP